MAAPGAGVTDLTQQASGPTAPASSQQQVERAGRGAAGAGANCRAGGERAGRGGFKGLTQPTPRTHSRCGHTPHNPMSGPGWMLWTVLQLHIRYRTRKGKHTHTHSLLHTHTHTRAHTHTNTHTRTRLYLHHHQHRRPLPSSSPCLAAPHTPPQPSPARTCSVRRNAASSATR